MRSWLVAVKTWVDGFERGKKKPPGSTGGFQDLVSRGFLSVLHSCAGLGREIKVPKIKADAIHAH
jgi:hypothetical protein